MVNASVTVVAVPHSDVCLVVVRTRDEDVGPFEVCLLERFEVRSVPLGAEDVGVVHQLFHPTPIDVDDSDVVGVDDSDVVGVDDSDVVGVDEALGDCSPDFAGPDDHDVHGNASTSHMAVASPGTGQCISP